MQITIREPGSALTHFIAMMMAVFAAVPLLLKAGLTSGMRNFSAMAVFMISMILLYAASATYHTVNLSGNRLKFFRKLDHMMIFVLIAAQINRMVGCACCVEQYHTNHENCHG